jgi:hypothetical protein
MQQDLLSIGLLVLLAALAVPNFKAFATGSVNLVKTPYKHPEIDKTRYKTYFTWVIGLTFLSGAYNLVVTRNLSLWAEATGLEMMLLAAGLVCVILYKKDDTHKK